MARYFVPTKVPVADGQLGSAVRTLQIGGSHVALVTEEGRLFTYGKGTPLCLPKTARKQWELTEVADLPGRVLDVACGPNSTALILEA